MTHRTPGGAGVAPIPAVCPAFVPLDAPTQHWCTTCGYRDNLHDGHATTGPFRTPHVLRLDPEHPEHAAMDAEVAS